MTIQLFKMLLQVSLLHLVITLAELFLGLFKFNKNQLELLTQKLSAVGKRLLMIPNICKIFFYFNQKTIV